MVLGHSFRSCWLLVLGMLITPAEAQHTTGPGAPNLQGPTAGPRPPIGGAASRPTEWAGVGQDQPARPPYRLAENTNHPTPTTPKLGPARPNEHPLMPALRWARDGIGNIEKIQDYSATMVKRERISGKVGETEYMFVKIRHRPLSVYVYFLGPTALKGREVIYVKGQRNGNMLAHTTGVQGKLLGVLELAPTGLIAMRGQRYPLTEIGVLNMTSRLIEVAEQDIKYGECEVKIFKGAEIKGGKSSRICTCIQVVHPVPRRNFLFHLARIFVDDELNIPIRYESYDWPAKPGGPPQLLEEYTFLNLKLNNGFTDADFDVRNPNYKFH